MIFQQCLFILVVKKRFSQGSVNPVLQRASSLLFDSIEDKNTLLNVEQKANYFMAEEGR